MRRPDGIGGNDIYPQCAAFSMVVTLSVPETTVPETTQDGKTLTMTIQPASGGNPNVLVFERE
jgi:hypothetical protein